MDLVVPRSICLRLGSLSVSLFLDMDHKYNDEDEVMSIEDLTKDLFGADDQEEEEEEDEDEEAFLARMEKAPIFDGGEEEEDFGEIVQVLASGKVQPLEKQQPPPIETSHSLPMSEQNKPLPPELRDITEPLFQTTPPGVTSVVIASDMARMECTLIQAALSAASRHFALHGSLPPARSFNEHFPETSDDADIVIQLTSNSRSGAT
jgi:hypothetical protein